MSTDNSESLLNDIQEWYLKGKKSDQRYLTIVVHVPSGGLMPTFCSDRAEFKKLWNVIKDHPNKEHKLTLAIDLTMPLEPQLSGNILVFPPIEINI